MLRRIYRAINPPRISEEDSLIEVAKKTERYNPCEFNYKKYKFFVSDFLSVSYQIKEYFSDERMKFTTPSKSPLIVDCGANVGVSVIYFKQLFPSAKIIAFEPDPTIASYFKKNIAENKINDVHLSEKAVWKNNDGINFGIEGADGGSIFFEGEKKIHIPTIRLRDLLAEHKIIDLLKIDIEGAEVEVIRDCDDTLKNVKNLFIEYHSWISNKQDLDILLNTLSKNGFRYYIHSIGFQAEKPFMNINSYNGMDVQLDIYAVNQN
jgi:FkbM family methyltransferase